MGRMGKFNVHQAVVSECGKDVNSPRRVWRLFEGQLSRLIARE
jgi:hypothetical protein